MEINYRTYLQKVFLVVIFGSIFFSCGSNLKENADSQYLSSIKEWDAKRIERLKARTGWLNLAGLLELRNGGNTFGSDKSNDIVFPDGKADKFIGSISLSGNKIFFSANEGVEVYHKRQPISEIQLLSDADSVTTVLNHKNLSWFIIKRGEKFYIRLRDFDSDVVKTFHGIKRFPVDTTWRVKAKYIKYDSPKTFVIPDVLGNSEDHTTDGYVEFKKDDKTFALLPVDTGRRFFFVYADLTSGKSTYGAGRFLYSDKPDEKGNLILDFNKAYNPPCAFTKFATCPVPPKENHLKLEITAGEKSDH